MQGPAMYSNIPPAQQGQQRVPGHVLNRMVYFILPLVMVVLVGGSMFWLQWASQRSLVLGYPAPHVTMFTSATNNAVQIRNSIQFTADSPGRGITYSWNFGDNTYGTGAQVSHSYQSANQPNQSFTVTVTATDALNQSSTTSQTVTVTVPPPQASFTYTSSTGYGYASFTFDASGSSADPSTSISTYNWDFGDQYNDPNGSQQESHTYYNSGTYIVTLIVTDALGQTSSPYTQTITI